MHDINFFSQLQSAGKVSSRSVITILSILIVIALNIVAVMFLNIRLSLKGTQLTQLNEYINSPQSIQLLADAASANEELRVKQAYYNAASALARDIKAAGMLTTDRLDTVLAVIPGRVTASGFSYTSGHLAFQCTSPQDADYLLQTIKALEDTGFFVSVISESISYIDPAPQDGTVPEGKAEKPAEPYCSFSIDCLLKEGGQ